jgi:hypothetical protein
MSSEQGTVGTPKVEGPVTGGNGIMVAGTMFDLAPLGYSESEYFVTGRATSYAFDGEGRARPADEADYRTRILVYRPTDPVRFNGTVVVEWLNVSGGIDSAPDWMFLHRELMRQGAAYVGVSAQAVGVIGGQSVVGITGMDLVSLDPERYGTLTHPGDRYSFDIFSQAGVVARGGHGTALDDLAIGRVIAIGESQSAFRLTRYVNDIDPLARVFDGFLVHARGGSSPPLDRDDLVRPTEGTPDPFRADLRVPVMCVEAETDLVTLGYLAARQDDTDRFRLWEMAGTSHADVYTFVVGRMDSGTVPIEELAQAWRPSNEVVGSVVEHAVNAGPQRYVLAAAMRHLDRWVRDGTPPPVAPRLDARDGAFAVDEHGIATGGIRTPHVDVPVAVLSGLGNRGEGAGEFLASLGGCTHPFSAEQLARLYPTKDDYVAKFRAAAEAAAAAGFVLPDDVDEMVAVAALNYPG